MHIMRRSTNTVVIQNVKINIAFKNKSRLLLHNKSIKIKKNEFVGHEPMFLGSTYILKMNILQLF